MSSHISQDDSSSKIRLFISYRRDDNPYAAGRLYDHLIDHFGEDAVYLDVTARYGGIDFRKLISFKIAECDAVIVVIGEKWLDLKDQAGNRRIDQSNDFVHIEIRSALDRGIPITPVTVDNGQIPEASDLPEALKELSYRNGFPASAAQFRVEVERIIDAVRNGIEINREILAAGGPALHDLPEAGGAVDEAIEAFVEGGLPELDETPNSDQSVFISYARPDNIPLDPSEEGWVSQFSELLGTMLAMRTGNSVPIWLDENPTASDGMHDQIEQTTLFLAVISPRYLNSEWCLQELLSFVRLADNNLNRLFLVFKYPVSQEQLPKEIQSVLGYQFYTNEGGVPVELTPRSVDFNQSVAKLAWSIKEALHNA